MPESRLACGFDDRTYRPGILDSLASVRQAADVAILLVARSRRRPIFTSPDRAGPDDPGVLPSRRSSEVDPGPGSSSKSITTVDGGTFRSSRSEGPRSRIIQHIPRRPETSSCAPPYSSQPRQNREGIRFTGGRPFLLKSQLRHRRSRRRTPQEMPARSRWPTSPSKSPWSPTPEVS